MTPLRTLACALTLAALVAPSPAQAGGETLKRAMGNLLFGPIDLAVSPITAGVVEYRNLRNIEDTRGVQIFYAVPGYLWLTGLHAGASVLRTLSGALELLPGLALVFTDAELDPIFDPTDRGEAVLLDYGTPVIDVKIGVDYTAAPF